MGTQIFFITELIFSIAIQTATAVMALRLIRLTGKRMAWSFIATAIVLMAIRRIVPLYRIFTDTTALKPDPANEIIALLISIIMFAGIYGIASVFNERKRIEDKLRESEERYRLIAENTIETIVLLDLNFRPVYVSPSIYKTRGFTVEEIFSRPPEEILTSASYQKLVKEFQKQIAIGSSHHAPHPAPLLIELEVYNKDGTTAWIELSASLLQDKDMKLVGILTVGRDISDRKKIEEELKKSEANLKEAQRLGRLGSWEWDSIADTITWSEEYYHIYGIDCHTKPPGYVEHLKIYTPESADRLDRAVKRNMKTGEPYEIDLQFIHPCGELRWVTARSETKRDSEGEIIGLRGTAQEITERKHAEEKIKQLNQNLEQNVAERTAQLIESNKELEAFSYSVAHDLRAPLRSIDSFSQILRDEYISKLDTLANSYITRLRTSAQRMAQLIDDLLNLSRLSLQEMETHPVNLSAMCREIFNDLRASTPERVVEFTVRDNLMVNGDAKLLHIAMTNLITNAWKFTSRREKATIEFGKENHEKPATFFLRDNGIGFDMTYAGKLFGAFERLHSDTEIPGTGIGLATVKRVIQRHRGRVWAEGEVEKGATFCFTIP